jgi:TolB-like protein/Tfp pilus assembly protein PilF
MALHIRLLGQFEAGNGTDPPIRFPTRKAEGLLAVLAAKAGTRLGREHLATLLWPDSGQQQARGSLRQTLNLLRKSLQGTGAPGVCADGDELCLDPTGIEVDLQAFEAGLAAASPEGLERAFAAYRGDFLANLDVGGEPFEEWRTQEQTRLRELAIAGFGRLLDLHAANGATERAIVVGERLLALDPSSEATYRSLMRAHLAQGARGGAIRQYQRCKKYLETHLDVEPEAETEALYRQIVDGSATRIQLPSRTHPSIAVVPFANLSGDSAQDYFAQGIAEDIVTELSRFRTLRVIARNSSFAASGAGRSAREVGAEFGATYVLEGSVRRAENAVRITSQLSEVATGYHVWADRYDAPVENVFELQDRITRAVAGALAVRIDEERLRKAKQSGNESLAAYDFWLRGKESLHRHKPVGVAQARELFQRALDIDPTYARAHCGLALAYYNDWNCHHWDRWAECQNRAYDHARKAVELDDSDHITHSILAQVHLYRREFELSEKHLERTFALNPNDADCLARMGQARTQLGDAAVGIQFAEAAYRLNPRYPDWYVGFTGVPYLMAARHDEAAAIMERAPDAFIDTRAFLAVAYAYLGQRAKARENAEAFLDGYQRKIAAGRESDSMEAMRWILHVTPFRHDADTRYLRKGLKKAGIGE